MSQSGIPIVSQVASFMAPPQMPQATPPPIPSDNNADVEAARKKQAQEQASRKGRASTLSAGGLLTAGDQAPVSSARSLLGA